MSFAIRAARAGLLAVVATAALCMGATLLARPAQAQPPADSPPSSSTLTDIDDQPVPVSLNTALATRVTVTFQNIACVEAFKVLSQQSGLNLALAPGVSGNISLFLTEVPVRTVLDIICELTGNAYLTDASVVRVLPEEEYIKRTGQPFRGRNVMKSYPLTHVSAGDAAAVVGQLGILTPTGKALPDAANNALVIWDKSQAHDHVEEMLATIDRAGSATGLATVVVPLQYAGSDSLIAVLAPHLTPGVGRAELVGARDRIAITDLPENIPRVQTLIEQLDVRPRQILLEVKILQITYSDDVAIGIDWEVIEQDLNNLGIHSAYSVLPRSGGDVSSGTLLTYGDLEDKGYNVMVDALAKYGSTDIVSLPRMLVLSGHPASLHVGSTEPFVTVDTRESQGIVSTFEKVTNVDVGLQLQITPEIHPNDFISLLIEPELSSVIRRLVTPTGSTIPVVEQSRMQTRVQVKSGVHLILGGLMRTDKRTNRSYVPVLGRIPVIKHLFGSTTTSEITSELVIMIAPRIVTGDRAVEVTPEADLGVPRSLSPEATDRGSQDE